MSFDLPARNCSAALILAAFATTAQSGEVYTGAWGGMVPASIEFLSDSTLRICQEDLVRQCQEPVPFTRDGETIVVEHLTSGRKWTYATRPGGGFDGTYFRWEGQTGYKVLATAVLLPR